MAHRAATRGLEGDTLFSQGPGQLGELARNAADDGAKLLVVVGGDGSVNEVANGIAGREDVEIAVIPRGTGWDFARTYKIPHKLDGAVDVALTGRPRTIDLGRATYRAWDGNEASTYFANVASAGMSGAIAQRANDTTKALGGKVSYLWATLAVFARWQNSELRLTVDDESRVGQMHDVVVANGRTFGGGMIICPEAEPDDGLFDVLTIGDLTKGDLLVTLPKTYRGRHLPHPKAELLRGKVVTIEADAPLPVELDGEQPGNTPARFEVVPGALRVRVPASARVAVRYYAGGFGAGAVFRAVVDLRRAGAFFDCGSQLLLELRDPLLQLVQPSQLLLHLVQPRLGVVRQFDELRATGHVRELVQRFGSEILEPREEVLLLCLGHGAMVPPAAPNVTTNCLFVAIDVRVCRIGAAPSEAATADAPSMNSINAHAGIEMLTFSSPFLRMFWTHRRLT